MAAKLTVVPSEETFQGSVEIGLTVKEATRVVWLHAVDLEVSEARFEVGGKARAARVVKGGEQLLGFVTDEEIPAGAAKLFVTYTGKVADGDDHGLFREQEGSDKYLYTQFETSSARRVFPCFDEPGFKVPWQLTLTVKAADTALSNTPGVEEKAAEDGWKTVRFAETQPLPSYLVAFTVGPFELVDAGRAGKKSTPLRFAVPRGRAGEVKFSSGAAGKILTLLEDTFGVPFPYEKLDFVLVPQLASFGAMENAGLITVGSRYVLADPGDEDSLQRRTSVLFMAHETAHQWFGDLVTPAWWDDIWLNEGFATWMENHIADRFDPAFHMEMTAIASASRVKHEDGLLSARKVRQEVLTEDDVSNAFDGITYTKGGALIGMFEAWMGEAAFRKGVRVYLERFSHRNATSNDFLTALGEGAGKDVKVPFSSFLDQPGVPLVTSKLSCDASGAKLSLSQERFLPLGSKGSAGASTWQIPVCVQHARGKAVARTCTLLTDREGELKLPALEVDKGSPCPDWVMPNAGGKGYYHS
ncbi:MAG: M1 family metallopeptidase, partial [Polyangiaceae bacterium]